MEKEPTLDFLKAENVRLQKLVDFLEAENFKLTDACMALQEENQYLLNSQPSDYY
jgi:hypothetical protein